MLLSAACGHRRTSCRPAHGTATITLDEAQESRKKRAPAVRIAERRPWRPMPRLIKARANYFPTHEARRMLCTPRKLNCWASARIARARCQSTAPSRQRCQDSARPTELPRNPTTRPQPVRRCSSRFTRYNQRYADTEARMAQATWTARNEVSLKVKRSTIRLLSAQQRKRADGLRLRRIEARLKEATEPRRKRASYSGQSAGGRRSVSPRRKRHSRFRSKTKLPTRLTHSTIWLVCPSSR